jgi:hypothetical protein
MRPSSFQLTQLRPFLPSDLKPVPKDWRIRGPAFVGIGAMKAGTSWWYKLLIDNPQIENNRLKMKELRYFIHFGYRGLKKPDILNYLNAFAAPAGSICGEWSPIYLYYPFCIKYLAETAPEAKILVILRNPVDCFLASLNEAAHHIHLFSLTEDQEYVFNVNQVFPWAIHINFFNIHINRLFNYFDRRQIMILQFEKCIMNPLEEIARTYQFLGVNEKHVPENITRPVNRKEYLVQKALPGERCVLADIFKDDANKLAKSVKEIDLALWPDFTGLT